MGALAPRSATTGPKGLIRALCAALKDRSSTVRIQGSRARDVINEVHAQSVTSSELWMNMQSRYDLWHVNNGKTTR